MARAEAASASIRSDSIKGLAQSIAKPAYHRLSSAEPLLRRAVPVLIIAFLITISIGAGVQVLEQRRLAVMDERQTIGALADQIAIEIDRPGRDLRANAGRTSDDIERALPSWAAQGARAILVADADGTIVAGVPNAPATDRTAHPRRARPAAALDHLRRRRRHPRDHAARRHRRLRHGARAEKSARPPRRGRDQGRRAGELALVDRADRDAVGDDGLRRAHPRLRLPLAGDARARSRPHPRHRARPHRYRAQSRPLRPVGLGFGARPRVLVAFDVRHARPAGQGRSFDLRRGQRAGPSRRYRPLRTGAAARRRQHGSRSTTPSACATPITAGCGCGCAANSPARTARPACISSASPSTSPNKKA